MKGGFHGLKVSQVSLILVGFVCVTVLAFTWRKTMLLTTLIPAQSSVLQLDLDSADPSENLSGNNNSVQALTNQIDSAGSSRIFKKGNVEGDVTNDEGEIPASVVERAGLDEISQRENISKEADKSTVEFDQTGIPSVTTEEKEISSSVIERTDSEELSDREQNSQQADTVPESVKSDETGILTDTTGKKGIPSSVVERTASDKLPRGKHKSQQQEIVPVHSLNKEPSLKTEQTNHSSADKDCNYAKGKWVIDDTLPLYSGFSCKQWLSPMWACRLTQRTDFEYEKLRWQPKACKMEPFTGPKFLHKMQDKTLAFIGDSLGRQQFQSLMCMATAGKERGDVLDVGHEYGLVKARRNARPDGWAYRFPTTNTTILYYWSASLCDLTPIKPSDPSTEIAMHLDRPPDFLRRHLKKFNVVVLNTGHHWNRGKLNGNKWIMYVGGKPNTNRRIASIGGAKNFTIHSVVKWADSEMKRLGRGSELKVFFRSISPRHFFNGDWNTGGTCDNTVAREKEVLEDESRDLSAAEAVRGTGVGLLDVTGLSEVRDEGHISRYSIRATPGVQDCLHWCLPGIPDAWNEVLFARI